jgi:hypothetical protein
MKPPTIHIQPDIQTSNWSNNAIARISNPIPIQTTAYLLMRFDQSSETKPATIAPSNSKSPKIVQFIRSADP